jgi:predicted transcriptional regulator of viral defense system
MNFIKFQSELKGLPVFSLIDLSKLDEKIYHHRLVEWNKKGLIQRIANGVYKFFDVQLDEFKLFFVANKIYHPSYISLETALAYYNFIPETIFHITSVSTKKTSTFNSICGKFIYKKIINNLFFGYSLLTRDNLTIKIAEPEKAILDYFYFHPELSNLINISELRFNVIQIKETISFEKIEKYLNVFSNKQLHKRVKLFMKFLDNADS